MLYVCQSVDAFVGGSKLEHLNFRAQIKLIFIRQYRWLKHDRARLLAVLDHELLLSLMRVTSPEETTELVRYCLLRLLMA